MLTLAKNSLSGNVMGKAVNAFALNKGVDGAPPPGEYDLLPPLADPIFGVYIIAVRRGSGLKPGFDYSKVFTGPVAPRHEGIKLPTARMASYEGYKLPKGAAGEAFFVLSKQQIPGRNCVVLAAGFSDLLDALSGAADAMLTVI